MTNRYRWIRIDWSGDWNDFLGAVRSNSYSPTSHSGFVITELGKERFSARYIKRYQFKEEVADPFGTVFEVDRLYFDSIDFHVYQKSSLIEVLNPPRSLSPLVNVISELTAFSCAVASLKIDVSDFLLKIGEHLGTFEVIELRGEIAEPSRKFTKRLTLVGDSDVRGEMGGEGRQPWVIKQAKLRSGGRNLSVNMNGTIAVRNDSDDNLLGAARQILLAGKS